MGSDGSGFSSFNPEPTATAKNCQQNAVAVGSGLNDILAKINNRPDITFPPLEGIDGWVGCRYC
jgi:hypothetical protein